MNRSHLRAALIVAVGLMVAMLTGVLAPSGLAQAPAAAPASPAIKAAVPASKPAWSKGIQPIDRDSYYHAIECGKLGGEQPSCVFYDADLCKNDDFVLSIYSPYKQVAYEVWGAVSRKRPVPTPSYSAAQQTRVVIGVTPVRGAKNQIADVKVRRGGKIDRRRHADDRRHVGELHLRLRAVCADREHHPRHGGEDPHAVLPPRPHRPLAHALSPTIVPWPRVFRPAQSASATCSIAIVHVAEPRAAPQRLLIPRISSLSRHPHDARSCRARLPIDTSAEGAAPRRFAPFFAADSFEVIAYCVHARSSCTLLLEGTSAGSPICARPCAPGSSEPGTRGRSALALSFGSRGFTTASCVTVMTPGPWCATSCRIRFVPAWSSPLATTPGWARRDT